MFFWNKKQHQQEQLTSSNTYQQIGTASQPCQEPTLHDSVTTTSPYVPSTLGSGSWEMSSVTPEIQKSTVPSKFAAAVLESLKDNITQNGGNLKVTRSFLEAVIEAAVLKSEMKLLEGKNINEAVTAACDQLISKDSPETNIPAFHLNLSNIVQKIHEEMSKYAEIEYGFVEPQKHLTWDNTYTLGTKIPLPLSGMKTED